MTATAKHDHCAQLCPSRSSCLLRSLSTYVDELLWLDDLSSPSQDHGDPRATDLSLLSWNILGQQLADYDYSFYSGMKPKQEPENWDLRFDKIFREIISADADIVCLQEVFFPEFEEDIFPAMRSAGYDGVLQTNKEDAHAVATFWKSNRLLLEECSSRSRTMTTILKDKVFGNNCLALVNCHLEGHPLKSVARITQLSHALNEAHAKYSHHGLVLCGDFNCELHSSACGAYLTLGSCPSEGVREWRRPVPKRVVDVEGHNYKLLSAYPTELGRSNRFEYFTYAKLPGRAVAGLDQIWHTPQSLQRVALRRLFKSEEQRRMMLQWGLPNEFHPSDHVPIGCVLRWKVETEGELEDMKEIQVQDTKQDIYDSVDGLLSEAEQLLNACPFSSEEERTEFEYVASDVPGLKEKVRPTEEQMLQLTDRRERRKQLFEIVPKEVGLILKRVIKLRKTAKSKAREERMNQAP